MITADDEFEALKLVCEHPDQKGYVTTLSTNRKDRSMRTASTVFVCGLVATRLSQRGLVTVDGSIIEPTDAGREEAAR